MVAGDGSIFEMTTDNTHNRVFELLKTDPSCRRVLDIPCGRGAFTKRLIDHGYEVYAADCVNMLEVKDQRVHFATANMNLPLPLADASLDAVACLDGIEHLERPFDFVRECRRVLVPGGRILISTPNISSLRSRWRWLLTGFHNKCKTPLDETNPNPLHHIRMLSFAELRYMLHTNDFEVSRVETNAIKTISWLYVLLVPIAFVMTVLVFRREARSSAEKSINRQVLRTMFSTPVLFGETLIIEARHRK